MKYSIVPVKNVSRLKDAADHLTHRAIGMPGIGLVWGETGAGKTTAATWLFNRTNGVYVRALSLWTPSAMLGSIARELDLHVGGSCAAMVEAIVERLAMTGRPLFVDEADYLIEKKNLVETLRDIHDLSTVPLILIGMGDIKSKLGRRPQLQGRIAQEVHFGAAELDDAHALAARLLEGVHVDDDLVEWLHAESKGSIRNLVVGLARIEQEAQAQGLAQIGIEEWPAGKGLFTGHDAGSRPAKRSAPKARAAKGLSVVEVPR